MSTVRRCDGWLVAATVRRCDAGASLPVLGKRDITNIKTNDVNVLAYLPGCRAIRFHNQVEGLPPVPHTLRAQSSQRWLRSSFRRCSLRLVTSSFPTMVAASSEPPSATNLVRAGGGSARMVCYSRVLFVRMICYSRKPINLALASRVRLRRFGFASLASSFFGMMNLKLKKKVYHRSKEEKKFSNQVDGW